MSPLIDAKVQHRRNEEITSAMIGCWAGLEGVRASSFHAPLPWPNTSPHNHTHTRTHTRTRFHIHHLPHNLTYFLTYALSLHLVSEVNRITFSTNLNSSAPPEAPKSTQGESETRNDYVLKRRALTFGGC